MRKPAVSLLAGAASMVTVAGGIVSWLDNDKAEQVNPVSIERWLKTGVDATDLD